MGSASAGSARREVLAAASGVVEIAQYGSTRSINASAAAAVVMYEWARRWA